MRILTTVGWIAAGFMVAAPLAAFAQGAPVSSAPAVGAPSPPSPRASALAHRYMEVMHVEEFNKKMMASMFSGMRGNLTNALGVSENKADETIDSFQAMLSPMVEKLVSRMEPIVAETFTEQELQAMVDFYGSPVGQSALQKIPTMTAKMSAISMEMMRDATAQASACKGGGCPPKP